MYCNPAFSDDFFAYTDKWHELTDSQSPDSVIAIEPQIGSDWPGLAVKNGRSGALTGPPQIGFIGKGPVRTHTIL